MPIYEQIANQVKEQILHGELKENDALPSVRSLAKDLQISALTIKKSL
jgi:GntR family transcriptional regulator